MRKLVLLAAALLVSGCAEYNFTPMPNRPDTGVDMLTDLRDCRSKATERYLNDTSVKARNIQAIAGAIPGAALLALGEGAPPPGAQPYDINAGVELCMHIKGYNGSIN